ncbi:MAG: NACHT domain-containing protein [Chloroflexota bacterium]
MEVIAGQPHLVLTGDAGTGKSSLARYVAIALAYACDPSAEKHDKVHGIDLLGLSWYHGPLLPLYVSLKDFAADSAFPRNKTSAGAEHLLKYLRKQTSTLQNFLSDYLTRPAAPNQPYHTLLILDGLDEIYETAHRLRLQNVIENWADRFPTCRILMTSRTYAYRPRDRWRLSPRFATAELAPFTRSQMRDYITNWYRTAARTRPSSFGGEARAARVTDSLTANMVGQIDRNERLLPMMRQPLLLALLTLIHESRKHLPSRRAELYQSAIDLLFQWRPIALDERFAATLASINEERLLAALKLAAFHVQVKQPTYQKFPGALERATLKRYLTLQDEQAGGIGCEVNNLLDYFGAQNGILLPALTDAFRFPHLSIQEFLAASALIEFYDEIEMPVERPPSGHWDFPQNLMALIKDDPYRWRQVALMVGSIMANNIGQDGRWNLIEELCPTRSPPSLTRLTSSGPTSPPRSMRWTSSRLARIART